MRNRLFTFVCEVIVMLAIAGLVALLLGKRLRDPGRHKGAVKRHRQDDEKRFRNTPHGIILQAGCRRKRE